MTTGRSAPPEDGRPLPAGLLRRQHEVQVVSGSEGCLAAAWTDDTEMTGMSGWTCGYTNRARSAI
jgi:hypothetical protein